MDDAAFQQRFDIARMVLERKYRWAKYVLRNLQPVARAKGTMAVDKHLRLYHGPDADLFTDQEFLGALWHEVNHILRHHPERLGEIHKPHKMDPRFVNLSADLEINDDLRAQGITLPGNVFYSDSPDIAENHAALEGRSAEEHFAQFVLDRKPPPPANGPSDKGDKPDKGDDDGDEADSGFDPNAAPQQGDSPGKGGDDDQNQSPPEQSGSNPDGSDGEPDPEDQEIPETDCGSGADGEDRDWEEPEPEPEERAKLDRDMSKSDEEVVNAVEQEGGLPPGMSQEVYDQAVKRLDRPSEVDWKQTIAVEIRNAMEQRADEAEEYTFRRRSRRAAISDEFILPGSYRPIPRLGVVVDISGSMDAAKVTATFRELVGILDRLAIPSFVAYPWNTNLRGNPVTVSTASDVKKILERRGGGTDMQSGLDYAVAAGDEVIVVLTDNETSWEENGPEGVPVILCGINRRGHHVVPKWTRLVDVESDKEDRDADYY